MPTPFQFFYPFYSSYVAPSTTFLQDQRDMASGYSSTLPSPFFPLGVRVSLQDRIIDMYTVQYKYIIQETDTAVLIHVYLQHLKIVQCLVP